MASGVVTETPSDKLQVAGLFYYIGSRSKEVLPTTSIPTAPSDGQNHVRAYSIADTYRLSVYTSE